MMKKYAMFLLMLSLLAACGQPDRKPVYYEEESSEEEVSDYMQSGDEVVVPFRSENGIKYVQVRVNGVGLEMIFDTGCSSTLISIAEANYLYQKGTLTRDDVLGKARARLADGSVTEDMVVNLKEVVIDDKIVCTNVQATVSSSLNAPLLLGNEVLDRLATIEIDNDNETIIFKIK